MTSEQDAIGVYDMKCNVSLRYRSDLLLNAQICVNPICLKTGADQKHKSQIAFAHLHIFSPSGQKMCIFTLICVNLHKSWLTRGPH